MDEYSFDMDLNDMPGVPEDWDEDYEDTAYKEIRNQNGGH